MLKGSALYIVIIISLVIALICSALVLAAYFYRGQYLVKSRFDRLQDNLSSGVNILLRTKDTSYLQEKTLSLFNGGDDSVNLKSIRWGIYDIGVVEAFKQHDTLVKVFSTAFAIDSSKWAAIYLIDEDRPLSVSGKTAITGDAYLPKAGVKAAYVDNKAYEGDKRMVIGTIHDSQRTLPSLNASRLSSLEQQFNKPRGPGNKNLGVDSLVNSFRSVVNTVNLGKSPYTLQDIKLSGNIILYADTLLTIDNTARLNDVMIFAKAIVVKSGFHGNCQLFATDSISVERNCQLEYPSCLGLLRYKAPVVGFPPQINIGQNSQVSGVIFTYEKETSALPATISVGKGAQISGQIYAQHIFSTKDDATVKGSVYTSRFMYQTAFTRYENYLINLKIEGPGLSRYYLTSDLIPVASPDKKILQWLEIK